MHNYLIIGYALLLAVGGTIGYVQSCSAISLAMGMLFGGAIILFHILARQGNRWAQAVVAALLALLLCFFGYRYASTQKIWPPGVLLILTLGALAAQLLQPSNEEQDKDSDKK